MTSPAPKQLLREWVALCAILAMVLGPLALLTSRGLHASERIAIASGAKPLVICNPGGMAPDAEQGTAGAACDHCTAAQPFAASPEPDLVSPARFAVVDRAFPSETLAGNVRARAPPARGPPAA